MEEKDYLERDYKVSFDCALKQMKDRNWSEAIKSLEKAGGALVKLTPLTSGMEREKYLVKAKALAQLIKDVKERMSRDDASEPHIGSQQNTDTDEAALEKALSELNELKGLEQLKKEISLDAQMIRMDWKRRALGLNVPNRSLHMALMGSYDGRLDEAVGIIARVYNALGVLEKAKVVELSVDDLLVRQFGQTLVRTEEKLREAMGGIAFIKEPYRAGDSEFGREITDAIYRYIAPNTNNEIVFIFTGEGERMKGFFDSNPSIDLRVPRRMEI